MNKEKVKPLLYVTDSFLANYKSEFNSKYIDLYKNEDRKALQEIFDVNDSDAIIKSTSTFLYQPLVIEKDSNDTLENIKRLYGSLKHISNTEAENEKLWIGLSNTYYLDYHIDELNKARDNKGLASRAHFTQGAKRALVLNNLPLLWWVGYYTYDENNEENPYEHTEFLVKNSNRSDLMIFLSSNIVSNKNIILGILDALEELEETQNLRIERYALSNSNKILNQIGGTKILDILSREEIKDLIVENLLDTDKLVFHKEADTNMETVSPK